MQPAAAEAKRRRQVEHRTHRLASPPPTLVNRQGLVQKVRDCPYLSSIKRNRLDFDIERVCSITGERFNIYACLICGQFLKGRGKLTPAFDHSLTQTNGKSSAHNLFISLTNAAVYCLPDNYEVLDASLEDIKFNLFPHYSQADIDAFEDITLRPGPPEAFEPDDDDTPAVVVDPRRISKALNGIEYLPGIQGLNSINEQTDYINVAIHLIADILPYRRYLLGLPTFIEGEEEQTSALTITLSNLMKQMFNYKSFKGMILPQALCLYCDRHSVFFSLTERGSAKEFLVWILNELIRVEGSKFSRLVKGSLALEKEVYDNNMDGDKSNNEPVIKKFLYLSLSLGASPLLNTSSVVNQPEEPHLHELLQIYGGRSENGQRMSLWKLPPYLLTHVERFTKNNFFLEKNPTMIKSPTKGLDLAEYMHPDAPKSKSGTRYSLAANIVHVGDAQRGKYVIQVARGDQWYEVEDLRVIPIEAHKAAVSQCLIQMWRREE